MSKIKYISRKMTTYLEFFAQLILSRLSFSMKYISLSRLTIFILDFLSTTKNISFFFPTCYISIVHRT